MIVLPGAVEWHAVHWLKAWGGPAAPAPLAAGVGVGFALAEADGAGVGEAVAASAGAALSAADGIASGAMVALSPDSVAAEVGWSVGCDCEPQPATVKASEAAR